jgi:VWFA-related protein
LSVVNKPVLIIGCLALTIGAAAQSQAPAPSDLVLRATTRMVLLDAVVTDRAGRPVTDLTKSDFTIIEDGKPQTIGTFSASIPPPLQQNVGLPPIVPLHVTTNRPDVIEASDRIAVLLLDGLNTAPENQVYLKQQMLKFLAEHFDPTRKLAVVALSGRLTVLQDFTSDPTLLKAALQQYSPSSPALARSGGERDTSGKYAVAPEISLPSQATGGVAADTSDPTAPASSGGSADTVQGEVAYMTRRFEKEAENFSRDVRISTTLGALQEIARYLAGQRGRKSLLWFSSGFPIAVSGVDPEDMTAARNYGEQLRRTTNLLNDAHVAIYTIDASGLLVGSISDPSNSGRNANGGIALTMEANKKLAKEEFARMTTYDTLERAAVDTGGRYFHGNDIANSIDVSLQEAGSYYLLGYYPANKKWDGKFRQVRVKIGRPGLTVRSRQGYFAVDPMQWEKDGHKDDLKAAVATNVLPATQVTFMARTAPPAHTRDAVVEFVVDSSTVSFITTAVTEGNSTPVARQSCSLNFEVQAYTPEGKLVKAEVQSANALLEPATYERVRHQGIPMKVPITLPAGRYLLHLGVRDNRTGLFGTSELALEITK